MRPHSLPLVMLGAGLLWFGWFGFNAGSALTAGRTAALAFMNTQLATATAVLGWMLVERLREQHWTTLGAASGAVSGLVAVTPACAFVSPMGACALGAAAGAVCALAVSLKWRLGFDDSLDVVGVHLVGGALGSVALGVLAVRGGLLYGGNAALLGKQALAVVVVGGFSFAVAWLVGKGLDVLVGFRVPAHHETSGIDLAAHGQTGYHWGPGPSAAIGSVVTSALEDPATLDA
jgi:Amt family ammonium transporter